MTKRTCEILRCMSLILFFIYVNQSDVESRKSEILRKNITRAEI